MSGKCKFCNRQKCFTRIYTDNSEFDELACQDHVKNLEHLADKTLGNPGGKRWQVTSSRPLKRG